MTENKTLEQSFLGMKEIELRLKSDDEYGKRMRNLAAKAMRRIKTKEDVFQYETYNFLKSQGCEDEEILWIYGTTMSTSMLDIINKVVDLSAPGVTDRMKEVLKHM